MKTLVQYFLLLWCLAYMALAEPCPLYWDGNPAATSYEVWRGTELLATVTEEEAMLDLPADALSTVVVIAVYPGGERLPSAPFEIEPVHAQDSADLTDWADRVFFVPRMHRRFYRFYFPVRDLAIPTSN